MKEAFQRAERRKMHLRSGLILLAATAALVGAVTGCSREGWKRVGQGALQGAARGAAQQLVQMQQTYQPAKLMLFGGSGHDIYLGCLSCPASSTDSVYNTFGSYGSQYSTTSIMNQYSDFGSQYSNASACNPYASDPPVVVDDRGNYFGRLTVNQTRTDAPQKPEIRAWLAAVCHH